MNFNLVSLFLTLVGGLVLAAFLGWIRRARLVLHVPRLFSHSALTAKGQLAEISVFNRGFKTEEAIEVSLNPRLNYEVVGSSSQEVTLLANKISIPRLGAGDDITTLVLVEGGIFSSGDITNCLSKESKGTIVLRLEDVPPTGPQRIQLVGVFVVFPALVYLAYILFLGVFDKEVKTISEAAKSAAESAVERVANKSADSDEIRGWKVLKGFVLANRPLFQAFNAGSIEVSVGIPLRKKDNLSVPVTVVNKTSIVINGNLKMNTQRSQGKIPSYDLSKQDIIISPGGSLTTSVNVVVPTQASNELDRKIYIEYWLKDVGDDALRLQKTQTVDPSV